MGSDAEAPAATKPARLPVNVADLRRRLGQRRTEPVHLVLSEYVVVQSRTTSEPVTGEVIVESIERGVSVTGTVVFVWEADCRRCLQLVQRQSEVDLDEIFQVDAPDDSELINFDGQQIDLVPIVRDAVVLSLPLVPLCGESCAGPDPDRYPAELAENRGASSGSESGSTVDKRWAELDKLTFDDH